MLQMIFDGRPTETMPVLTVDQLHDIPTPDWLIEYRLPEGQTWVYGEPGVGKTFIVLDWACTVAARGNTVIYCVGEGVKGFSRRVFAWKQAHPDADLSKLYVIPMTPALLNEQSVETFVEVVNKYAPKLVVIDTFARAAVGGDENSAKDVGVAIAVLDSLFRIHDCSSIVVHHSTKGGNNERGSGAIRGAADATWEISPDYTHGVGTMKATCRKMKDYEPPASTLVKLMSVGDSAVVYPSAL